MCGIAGIVSPGRPAASLTAAVELMCAPLHHRGPDGRGTYVAAGVAPDVDPEALYAYMALSYVPAPLSIFRGAQKLLPAERAVWANGQLRRQIYWNPRPVRVPRRRADAAEALAQRLEASVRAHLV